MLIALGTDHAGYAYKELLKAWLIALGHTVHDCGTFSAEPCDYPVFVRPAAAAVAQGLCERAIVLGGSGNGEAIVANRLRGVRCAVCWNRELARLSRAHNNANVLSIPARFVSEAELGEILDAWLNTPFEGGRHERRVALIDAPEE